MDKNLCPFLQAKTQAHLTDLKEAWTSRLKHTNSGTNKDSHLRQPGYPVRFPYDIRDFRPLLASQAFQGNHDGSRATEPC